MSMYTDNAARELIKPARHAAPNKHAVLPPSTRKHAVQPLHLVEKVPEKEEIPIAVTAESVKKAAKVFVLTVMLLAMFSTLVYERVQMLSLNSKAVELEERIDDARSETVRLDSEFNSLFSIDSIEKYAVEELGMVKRQKYQVRFFTNDGEDEIVLFNAKQ